MARPKGSRNKATEFIKPIAQRYGPDCIHALINIVKNSRTKPFEKTKAAELILAYGFGKPVETHEVGGIGGGPLAVTWEEKKQALQAILDQAEGRIQPTSVQ